MKRNALGLAFALALSAASAAETARDYPSKPIRMVLPFPPGGSTEIMARTLGQKLAEAFGKNIVVDNRGGGAGGIAGTDLVAKATPDGYVLLFTTGISHTAGASLYKLPYDPVRDFEAITLLASAPQLMVVSPSLPANTVQELVELAKAKPGQLNYASGGLGTSTHLPAEMFRTMTGINMVHVPYKGGGPSLIGVISGESQMLIISAVAALPHVKSRKLRAIAVTSAQRWREMPEVPTVAESGVEGYEVVVWYGLFAPRGTPRTVVGVLHREIVKILQTPDMQERLARDGAVPVGSSPAELTATNKAEVEKWARVVRTAKIRVD
jgi:tripartite-type tricarboxylate transporter receptor subunit TctC